MSGTPATIEGTAIGGLSDYQVSVAVTGEVLGPVASTIASSASLRVTVTVTHSASTVTVKLDGYRTRYAPNALP